MSQNIKRLDFVPQLDSFRFFAVILVIIAHWILGNIINEIPNGYIGVTFFFVLSGFLISSNLLYVKEGIVASKITKLQALKIFYIRRTLRIFPLYYFALFALLLLLPKIYNDNFLWYVCYLPNIYFYHELHWAECCPIFGLWV